jgi:hypothetical protein
LKADSICRLLQDIPLLLLPKWRSQVLQIIGRWKD